MDTKLVDLISQQNADAFKEAFEESLASRVSDALEMKKIEVAQSLFDEEAEKRQVEPPPSSMPSDTHLKPLPKKGKRTTGSFNKFGNYTPGMREDVEQVAEKAPAGAKYERMVKHIKKQYSKDGVLTGKEKAIAYATAWKAKNKAK